GPVPETEYGFDFHPRTLAPEHFAESEMVRVSDPPLRAINRAIPHAFEMTRNILLGIVAIFQRKVPAASVGGPIMLFQLAGAAAQNGLGSFMQLFAMISINLGLMNLLPVPVLDGFHILVAGMESVSRRAVPMRVREIAAYVGIALILL